MKYLPLSGCNTPAINVFAPSVSARVLIMSSEGCCNPYRTTYRKRLTACSIYTLCSVSRRLHQYIHTIGFKAHDSLSHNRIEFDYLVLGDMIKM